MEIPELLEILAEENVSDILLVSGTLPRVRCNGELFEKEKFGLITAPAIDAFRINAAGAKGEEEYRENEGLDLSIALSGNRRCRINFFSTIHGPGMAVRPLRSGSSVTIENSSLPEILKEFASSPRGLVLITGATGSGKTTTLSAMVNFINQNFSKHILMIEDPVEYLHTGKKSMVTQREIASGEKGRFQQALKFALRENPDVVVIGEIRDPETMETALNASLTGHLVIASLHTTDTVQSVERVLELYPESLREQAALDLSLAINGVISQRLLPKADGSGVVPVMEILSGTPTVKKQIAERDLEALELTLRSGRKPGMITFNRSLLAKYNAGVISFETAIGASSNPEEFKLLIRGMENGSATLVPCYGTGDETGEIKEQIDMRSLLRSAVRNSASDLILTAGVPPLVKISGTLQKLDLPELMPMDIERLVFSIVTRRQRIILEEKKELDFALSVRLVKIRKDEPETVCRFRLNAFYQRGALGVVARIINDRIPEPGTLRLPAILSELIRKKQGLILVTGPTGSGKSTTLASLIQQINRERACHIVTVEDPIEYIYENCRSAIEQRELHGDTLSFAGALRSAMREAPDVILLGEMRDIETIGAALTAAETGHLVLATLHTNSAAQTVDRIVDSFPGGQQNQIRQQLAATLLAVVSQRLLPRKDGKGMIAAFEIMVGTPPVRALIRENKSHLLQSTLETSFKDGMQTMEKSLTDLYAAGLINQEETTRFAADYTRVKDF